METHFQSIATTLNIAIKQVSATLALLDEGATVPFISRYRKEVTGSLDEVQVITIKNEIERLRQLEQRREAILKSIEEMPEGSCILLQASCHNPTGVDPSDEEIWEEVREQRISY